MLTGPAGQSFLKCPVPARPTLTGRAVGAPPNAGDLYIVYFGHELRLLPAVEQFGDVPNYWAAA
jgi:hypothetical protein